MFHKLTTLKGLVILSITLVCLLLVIFNTTKPDEIGAAGILIVFILLYLLSFTITLIALRIFMKVRVRDLSNSSQFMLVSTVASVPVIALALHTLGQLFFRDFVILTGLSGITIFYWLKRG